MGDESAGFGGIEEDATVFRRESEDVRAIWQIAQLMDFGSWRGDNRGGLFAVDAVDDDAAFEGDGEFFARGVPFDFPAFAGAESAFSYCCEGFSTEG